MSDRSSPRIFSLIVELLPVGEVRTVVEDAVVVFFLHGGYSGPVVHALVFRSVSRLYWPAIRTGISGLIVVVIVAVVVVIVVVVVVVVVVVTWGSTDSGSRSPNGRSDRCH